MNKKKLIVPLIVVLAVASFWIFVVLNEMAQHDADNEEIQRRSLNSLPKSLDTTICKNAISDWLDAKYGKKLEQKNEATLKVLENCDVESLTMNDIHRSAAVWEK